MNMNMKLSKNVRLMKMDYSASRMTDLQWIEDYSQRLGKEKLDDFIRIAYGWLMDLDPGQTIDLTSHPKITDRNRDLFIKIGCLFISEGNNGYEFSNDYTKITNNSYVPRPRPKKENKDVEKVGGRFPISKYSQKNAS